jgi:hypothetical protein
MRLPLGTAGLRELAELPALRQIIFENSEIPEQGLQRIKKKLPKLRWSIY